MRHFKTLASALAIVLVMLMATDYVAMAATGKPLILGKINKAGKTTTIKSTRGPALQLTTKPGQPPLTVNRQTKVSNLNADLVDGKSAKQFTRTRVFTSTFEGGAVDPANGLHVVTPRLAKGDYLVSGSGWIFTSPATQLNCVLSNYPNDPELSSVIPEIAGGYGTLALVGVMSLPRAAQLDFYCYGEVVTDISTYDRQPLQLTFTRVSSVRRQSVGAEG